MKKRYVAILILICLFTTACNKTLSKTIKNNTYTLIKNDKNLIVSKDKFTFLGNGKGTETVIIDTTPNDKNTNNDTSKTYKFRYEINNSTNEIKVIYSNTEILFKYNEKTKCIENENKEEYCIIKGE